jgi:hypothetical protein
MFLVLVAGMALMAAACGDDGSSDDTATPAGTGLVDTSPSNTDATDTTGPGRTVPDGTEPGDTEPETSDPGPTTSVTTSTAPATSTTTPAPVTGWEVSDFVPGAAVQGYSGNWAGDAGPSPAAPTGTNPPADGWYVATLREPWDPARPDALAVRIQRLELCSVLPGGCDNMDDPSEMNIDPTWQLDLDLPLDATTDVVVGGFKCWDAPEQKQGTGVELADLFTAYTADYAAAIEPRLSDDGMTNGQLALDVAASPTGGFVGEEAMCPGEETLAGPLRYAHDDAPVLLLQSVTDWDGGPLGATDLVRLGGVQYTGGVPVFYFYAGFYS